MAAYDGTNQGVSGGTQYVLVQMPENDTGPQPPQWMPVDQFQAAAQQGGQAISPSQASSPPPSGGVAVTPLGAISSAPMGIQGQVFQDASGNIYAASAGFSGATGQYQQIGNVSSGVTLPATGQTVSASVLQSNINSTSVAAQQAQNSGISPSDLAMLTALGIGGAGALGFLGGSAAVPAGTVGATAADTGVSAATGGAVGGTGATAADLGGALSGSAVDPLTGLPASGIQSTIDSLGTSAGTGLPDLGTGAATTAGMAGTSTGIPLIDNAVSNTGVNLANSAGASLPGLGSAPTLPELGGAASVATAANALSGGTSSGTGTGSGSSSGGSGLGSLAGISALVPGLAMIGSVAAGNKGADTSNLSNIANELGTMAGSNIPDTSGLAADAAALTGPNSTEALLTSQANSLIPSVSTGSLPPGAQTLVNNALNDATNSIKSKYAQLGLTGSTMESQELASANSQAQAQSFQYAQQLTNTGISDAAAATSDINSAAAIQTNIINAGLSASGLSATELGTSATIYNDILQSQVAQDIALQTALANFASASAIGVGLAASGSGGSSASGLVSSLSGLGSGISNLVSSAGSGLSSLVSSL